jgi:CBS domain-containing protein
VVAVVTVQSILDKKGARVVKVSGEASVLDAATLMNHHRIGGVVVTEGELVVGIFTERDVLCRVVAARRDPAQTSVRDVMTSPVACCAPETTRAECRTVMRHRHIRHLPVVTDGRLVGIVSMVDILEDTEEEQRETIRYLHEYLYGEWA